jgi:hypothetical protein
MTIDLPKCKCGGQWVSSIGPECDDSLKEKMPFLALAEALIPPLMGMQWVQCDQCGARESGHDTLEIMRRTNPDWAAMVEGWMKSK